MSRRNFKLKKSKKNRGRVGKYVGEGGGWGCKKHGKMNANAQPVIRKSDGKRKDAWGKTCGGGVECHKD